MIERGWTHRGAGITNQDSFATDGTRQATPLPTRREFLQHAGAAAVGFPFVLNRSVSPAPRSCIVIGAGLSGLAAAYKLKRGGWNVTVLEARDRLGGRVLSYSFGEDAGLVCELGAEWIGKSHKPRKTGCGWIAMIGGPGWRRSGSPRTICCCVTSRTAPISANRSGTFPRWSQPLNISSRIEIMKWISR